MIRLSKLDIFLAAAPLFQLGSHPILAETANIILSVLSVPEALPKPIKLEPIAGTFLGFRLPGPLDKPR